MTEKEILLQLVTKAYNKTETEIQEMIYETSEDGSVKVKDNAHEFLLNLDAGRVNAWKTRQTESMTKLANEKTASINSSWEQLLKEQFAITDDLRGQELVEKIKTIQIPSDGKGKSTKEYIELESKHQQLIKEIESKYIPIEKFNEFKNGVEVNHRKNVLRSRANDLRSSMQLIYPENETIKNNLVKAFNEDLLNRFDDAEILEDGKIYPLKGGQRIENSNGYAVEYSEIVREVASGYFQEAKQTPTGNGGNRNDQEPAKTNIAQLEAKLNDQNLTNAQKLTIMTEIEKLKLQK